MEEARIERVSRRADSVENYYRLYSILKSVLPNYVGKIGLLETSRTTDIHHQALFIGGEVVGGYVLKDEGDVAYLAFIGLTEGMQNKGLGKLMTQHMCEKAIGLGRDRIRAETFHLNVPKFKKMGFREEFTGDKGHVPIYLDVQ